MNSKQARVGTVSMSRGSEGGGNVVVAREIPPTPRVPDILDTPHAGPAAIRGSALRVAAYGAGLMVTAAPARPVAARRA
jgi:hypothetical protein